MATENKDVLMVFDTPANLSANLRAGMKGYDTTNDRFAIKRLADSVMLYISDDTQQCLLTSNQTVAGIKTFSSFPVTPSSAPTTDYQVANKKYVDDSIAVEDLWDRDVGNQYTYLKNSNDYLGISTSTPATDVHILTDYSSTTITNIVNFDGLLVENTNGAANSYASIALKSETYDTALIAIYENASNTGRTAIIVDDSTGTAAIEALSIESNTGNVGIGITSPDGKLHIHAGSAGVVSPNVGADTFVIENSAGAGMTILTPDANDSVIVLGSLTDAFGASIRWNYDAGLMRVGTSSSNAELALEYGNASEAVRIDSSGQVCVGDTSPGSAFDVAGIITVNTRAQSANPRVVLKHNSVSANNYVQVDRSTGNMELWVNNGERISIDTSGQVGIGATSPQADLEVSNTTATDIAVRASTESVGSVSNLRYLTGTGAPGGTNTIADIYAEITQATPSVLKGKLVFRTNSGDALPAQMTIDSDGNLGLGGTPVTQTAGLILTVSDAKPTILLEDTDVASGTVGRTHYLQNEAGTLTIYASAVVGGATSGSAASMSIDSSGNVDIPTGTLDVGGITTLDSYLEFKPGGTSAVLLSKTGTNDGFIRCYASGATKLNLTANGSSYFDGGNVGIGETSPNAKLTLNIAAGTSLIQSFKSDSSHSVTTVNGASIESDDIGWIKENENGQGGLQIGGITADTISAEGMAFTSVVGAGESVGSNFVFRAYADNGASGVTASASNTLFDLYSGSNNAFSISDGGSLDLTFGFGYSTGSDTRMQFYGGTNNGYYEWREDEDYFLFVDDILMNSAEKISFRDTAIGIYSQADTYLDIFADGGLRIGDSSAGAPTNYITCESDGKMFFTGTAGLAHGEIYCSDVGTTITISSSGQVNKVQITAFDQNGFSRNMTPDHTNDHITVDKAGQYLATISLSIESTGGTAYVLGVSLYKNNGATEFQNVHGNRSLSGGGSDIGSMSLSGIIDCAATDTIELWVWNETNTNDIIIQSATISLLQIGGT